MSQIWANKKAGLGPALASILIVLAFASRHDLLTSLACSQVSDTLTEEYAAAWNIVPSPERYPLHGRSLQQTIPPVRVLTHAHCHSLDEQQAFGPSTASEARYSRLPKIDLEQTPRLQQTL